MEGLTIYHAYVLSLLFPKSKLVNEYVDSLRHIFISNRKITFLQEEYMV
jgi:hypothetical protein